MAKKKPKVDEQALAQDDSFQPQENVMNDSETQVEATAADPKPNGKAVVEIVQMEDGTTDEFAGKRRLNKTYVLNDDGTLNHARFNFRNGRVVTVTPPPSMIGLFAGHGVVQKVGDSAAIKLEEGQTEVDIDDMVLAVERTAKNIHEGKWSERTEGDGSGGTSLLIKALVIYGGSSLEDVKAFLEDKDAKFKRALAADESEPNADGKTMAQIIKDLKAIRDAKGVKVDTGSALKGLKSLVASKAA